MSSKEFSSIQYNPFQASAELDQLGELLEKEESLDERDLILPFFQQREHLSALISTIYVGINRPDLIAFEYDLFGDFRADLVIGDSQTGSFFFIEFEDAKSNSIFKKQKGRYLPEWSKRFEHGFSQITDWFWRLEDLRRTDQFRERFGKDNIHYEGLLVIGRDVFLNEQAKRRFEWRKSQLILGSKQISCFTFDQLYLKLSHRMGMFQDLQSIE